MVKSYVNSIKKYNPTICPGRELEALGRMGRQHETGIYVSHTSLDMRRRQSHMVTQLSF